MKAIYFFDEGENTLFDEAFPSRGITVTPYEGKFAPFVKGNLFKAPSKGYYTFFLNFQAPPRSLSGLFYCCTRLSGLILTNFNI